MSIPENRPPRVVLVHLPGSPGRKHVEAYQLPLIPQTARPPSCHGPVLAPTQASRSRFLFLATRQSRSLSALEILFARVDDRAIERGFLSLHFRLIVSLEVLQGLVAALACKALQIH